MAEEVNYEHEMFYSQFETLKQVKYLICIAYLYNTCRSWCECEGYSFCFISLPTRTDHFRISTVNVKTVGNKNN